jgi:hypothetical protein
MSGLMTAAVREAIGPAPVCNLSLRTIAGLYQTSPQNISNIIRRHDLDKNYVSCPHRLHATLSYLGNDSPLRRSLEDRQHREELAAVIAEKQTSLSESQQ